MDADDPAALAELLGQRIDPDERVRALIQRPIAECGACSSRCRAIAETCDLDNCVTPSDSASFSTRRVDTPSR